MIKITKPNTKETNQAYWEKVLRSHGLGVDQPITDNSDAPSGTLVLQTTGQTKADDRKALRGLIDADDPMIFSHEIKKTRSYDREAPDWALDDEKLKKLLLLAFPRLMKKGSRHTVKAAAWVRVVYLYYRMGLTFSQVAREMGLPDKKVLRILISLRYVSQGLTVDGTKRKRSSSSAPVRETGEEHERENFEGSLLPAVSVRSGRQERTFNGRQVPLP